MKTKFQFFSHRPPSKVTLLNDPWPNLLQAGNHRKTFHWPAYRTHLNSVGIHQTEDRLGLQA